MKLMTSILSCLSCAGSALQLSRSSFSGTWSVRRSFARQLSRSSIIMMPEGPEVRNVVDQLQGGVGKRLVDIKFVSGRYTKHGRPGGFQDFATTMTPSSSELIDTVEEWNCKGKFIYLVLDEGGKHTDKNNTDFCRSIWVTLGMTGQFVNEQIHEQDPRFCRWYFELMDVESGLSRKVYYHDQRNFGTLKFCLSKLELEKKILSLGPDVLSEETTESVFLERMEKAKDDLNICKFLMDQSKVSGVGNYVLAEALYRASIDPFASLKELDEGIRCRLFREIQGVVQDSYQAQGLTRRDGGTFRTVEGDRGQFEFQLQCYGRELCVEGDPVIKETNGPHKRTIWYTQKQLFKPLNQRLSPIKVKQSVVNDEINNTAEDMHADLISGLEDEGWNAVLSDSISSDSFGKLDDFIKQERASGVTIYPPQSEIFSALNLCSFEKTKVVIVGQDPYHGRGQGHGLAFSVRKGVREPPSLKNIIREAIDDLAIQQYHGNLGGWAKQGVLLMNCVLTVRQGEANSHAKKGWEEFTDEVIRVLNEEKDGLVFLLWGSAAQKKASVVDENRHTLIQTSHPSPLGATKTKSPFLGSRCFSRANEALKSYDKEPVDWDIL